MASADARLRLVIDAVSSGGNAFSGIVSQAQTAAREIQTALSGASGAGGALGGKSGGVMGPIIPNDALSGLVNFREQVSMTRQQLVDFATKEAKAFGLSIGQNVVNPANVATGDLKDFYERVNDVKVQVDEVNPKLDAMGKMFAFSMIKEASAAITEFGKTVLQFLGDGVKSAAEFESTTVALRNALEINVDPSTQSVGGLNTRLEELKQKATDVALVTKFNDSQILESITLLGQNGISSDRILSGAAASAASMAQATNTQLIPATEALTGIMHGFSKTLGQEFGDDTEKGLGRVSDIMTNIKLSTGASLTDIANSMKYVAPVADEFGLKFDQVATYVDVLYRSGIRGSQTGTALKRMLTSIAAPTNTAATAIDELAKRVGLSGNMFISAEGKVKPLVEIQRLLYESTKDLSDAEKAHYNHAIFGQYALQSMMKIAGTAPAQFKSLSDMVTQTGTAAKVSADWAKTAEGQWQAFTENIGVAKRQLGTELLGAVKQIIAPFNALVTAFTNLSPATKNTIATVAAVVGGLAVLLGTIGSVVSAFGLFTVGLTLAGTSLGAIVAACLPVVAIVAAVVAGAYLLYEAYQTNFGGLRDIVQSTLGSVKAALSSVVDSFRTWVSDNKANIDAFLGGMRQLAEFLGAVLLPIIQVTFESIARVVGVALTAIIDGFKAVFAILGGVFQTVMAVFRGDWEGAWNGLVNIVKGIRDLIVAEFRALFGYIWALIEPALKAIVTAFGGSWDTVKAKTAEVFTSIIKWFVDLPSNAMAALTAFGTWLTTSVTAAWIGVTSWLSSTLTSIQTWFSNLPTNLAYSLGFVAGWLSKEVPKAWTAFTTWLDSVLKAIAKWFTNLPTALGAHIASIATYLNTAIPAALTAFSTWLDSVLTAISLWFGALPGKTSGLITTFGAWLTTTIPATWTAFTKWLDAVLLSISTWFAQLPGNMMSALNSAIQQITAVGKSIGTAIWDGITSILKGIGNYVANLVNDAINSAKRLWDSVKSGFSAGQAAADGGSSGSIVPHAAGGIFTGPTLLGNHLFGESGKEAIVPLSKWNMMAEGFQLPGARRDVDMGGTGGVGGGGTVVHNNNVFNYNGSGSQSDFERFARTVVRQIGSVNA